MTPNHRALLFPISVLGTATLPCRMPICTMWIDGSRANSPPTPLLTTTNEPTVHTLLSLTVSGTRRSLPSCAVAPGEPVAVNLL